MSLIWHLGQASYVGELGVGGLLVSMLLSTLCAQTATNHAVLSLEHLCLSPVTRTHPAHIFILQGPKSLLAN